MRNRLSAIYFVLFILFCFSQTSFARRNDFSFDISPLIEKNKMFSAGMGGIFSEYNSWFNTRLYTLDPYNENISRRDIYFTFMPYFSVRPIKYLELDVSASFIYQRQDSRNDITSATNMSDWFGFDSINASVKATFLDWYLSIGAKVGLSYTFRKNNFLYGQVKDPLNIYATIMLAGIPKVIPVNFLFAYTFDTRDNLMEDILKTGEIVGGIEIITSPFITLYTGVTYVFPYTKESELTYLEPFVKFKATISDFLYMTVSYHKVVWGKGYAPNTSTFDFSIEYMFYSPKWDWWHVVKQKEE
ncbi:hypothetical protein Q5M87_00020 [Brachyspira innocens]|uniref:Uncharacterized protein n=1 Tax=Brachyspira innocens TaxID=13264 RepID=A0ABT8YXZ7_9SPIR|nr:hypothetical protein [Brachyspira innocens]MDO6992389.1 hypothetical protein [Brachyspira innocens]MDO7020232.1 hypothetical protein [Brachyspira innocens]